MLEASDYPRALKQRIAGRFGHLHNEGAAALLRALDTTRLQHIIAAHLSQAEQHAGPGARGARAARSAARRTGSASPTRRDGFDWREFA